MNLASEKNIISTNQRKQFNIREISFTRLIILATDFWLLSSLGSRFGFYFFFYSLLNMLGINFETLQLIKITSCGMWSGSFDIPLRAKRPN